MNTAIIRFKLLKVRTIIQEHGLKYALQFLWGKLKKRLNNARYYRNYLKQTSFTKAQIEEAKLEIKKLSIQPLISILMPVYNVDEKWLVKAIDSVRNQVYPNWELCIADDASNKPHIKQVLEKYASIDSRIKITYREESGNISAASNTALSLAQGEYIGLLDHDDELTPNALFEVVKWINRYPDADLLYSDEDKIDENNNHFDAWFKPNWSPEYLYSHMYVCHFSVYRKSLITEVGSFRSAFDGAQDYDLCLRVATKTNAIYHVPKILYHWRTIATSTAANPLAKRYAYEAGRKAVEEHLKRLQLVGNVSNTAYYGVYETTFTIEANPLVSIIIPSAGKRAVINGKEICLLMNCIDSIKKSSYQNIEIIVVDGNDLNADIIAFCKSNKVRLVHVNAPFNFSERMNKGVSESKGDYLLLLNDDTEIVSTNWIEGLLGFAQQQAIGAVGAKLITEQDRIQHAGIICIDGAPGHIYYNQPNIGQGYFNALCSYKNYLAVTGACLMISRTKWNEAKGMDESFPVNYNDVDFCLKLHQLGYRNVFNAHVVLYHYESISRGKGFKPEELLKFRNKWKQYEPAISDPYYHQTLVAYPHLLK